MTRVATPENESDLLNIALYGTAVHEEKLVRDYPRAREAEALDAANLCHAKRTLTWYHDDDGSVVFHCRIELETGASRWGGETMDYDVAIHALFEADGGLGRFSSRT